LSIPRQSRGTSDPSVDCDEYAAQFLLFASPGKKSQRNCGGCRWNTGRNGCFDAYVTPDLVRHKSNRRRCCRARSTELVPPPIPIRQHHALGAWFSDRWYLDLRSGVSLDWFRISRRRRRRPCLRDEEPTRRFVKEPANGQANLTARLPATRKP
jgi:hypothetical protein